MSKFSPYEVSRGGDDRICYERSVFPMGTYTTGWFFEAVTFKYGILPMVFSGCDFERVVFDRVDMRHVVFIGCVFGNCQFKRCDLSYATFVDCRGHNLSLRRCNADSLLMMHLMLDGINLVDCVLPNFRLTVNTEYLAPIRLANCNLEGAHIENIGHMDYLNPFGTPVLGTRDRASVKINRCTGAYKLAGFKHAYQ